VQAQAVESVPKNDPGVALEWSGPAVVKVNTPTEYTLNVRNTCGQPLQQVVVQVRSPKGTDITAVAPAVKPTDGVYLWDLGTLDAKTSKAVTVTLKQPAKGEMACQAWVTLTGTSAMKAAVKEPKLAVMIKAPKTAVIGDPIPYEVVVSNPGDHTAEKVEVRWAERTHAVKRWAELKPGEAGSVRGEMTSFDGRQRTVHLAVAATGADGLNAFAKTTVQILVPKLDVKVTGPAERLIGTKGKYTVEVMNSGDVPVSGVTVRNFLPAGFKVGDTPSGTLAGDKLTHQFGEIVPGQTKLIVFEGSTNTPGAMTLKAEATGDRNTKASGECVTTVEGIPGLRMELVDSADPVEKNGEITYEIKVTNTGTKADSDVRVVCELPTELEFVSCSGPTKGAIFAVGGIDKQDKPVTFPVRVVFDPISDLAPKTEAVFKVKVKGTGTGDVRFKAVMTSKHLTAPVTKEESTRVYGE
jgi:uncharacterized repeat protein (TIGR01451 family)